MTTMLIGVGNRERGDDAIGPLVADAVASTVAGTTTRPGVGVVAIAHEGDLSLLALRWEAGDDVVIVDAVVAGGATDGAAPAVGDVAELDRSVLSGRPLLSTHGLGVAEALALAERLGRSPRSLRILGIGVRDVAPGPLSTELSARLPRLVESVAATLGVPYHGTQPPGGSPAAP